MSSVSFLDLYLLQDRSSLAFEGLADLMIL